MEAAEPIERAFAANLLDVDMLGDWEEVRRQLGVEGLGLEMPHASLTLQAPDRRRTGLGIFSDRPIFPPDDGEDGDSATDAYFRRAYDSFAKSSEGRQIIESYGRLNWHTSLLDFGVEHLGAIVDQMTCEDVADYVLEYVPRQVSTQPESAPAIVDELLMFWTHLQRAYNLPNAPAVIEWLQADGLSARLKAMLSDPENFGMAKSMVMAGIEAGYDMTTQEGMAEFIEAYNRRLLGESWDAPPPPPSLPVSPVVSNTERIGRNAPCPCGSGKKFKKCCGGSQLGR